MHHVRNARTGLGSCGFSERIHTRGVFVLTLLLLAESNLVKVENGYIATVATPLNYAEHRVEPLVTFTNR
jgi:hypothetical protein